MKQLITVTLAILALTAPRVHAAIIAGPFTNAANNHIYYLISTNTWTAAEAEAVNLGGHLVTINDATEQQWVFSTFASRAGNRRMWIGLTDRDVEGRWGWISGDPFDYAHWATNSTSGSPDNFTSGGKNQDYAMMYSTNVTSQPSPGTWDDRTNDGEGVATVGIVEVIPGVATQVILLRAVEIAWPTHTTNLYQIQWSSSLNTNDWFNLNNPIQGTGSTNYYLDSTRGVDRRFYRVLTLQP